MAIAKPESLKRWKRRRLIRVIFMTVLTAAAGLVTGGVIGILAFAVGAIGQ